MMVVVGSALLLSGMARNESPVADAAMRRDVEKVRLLLQHGADVNAPQGDGMTALHWAAEHGDAALAEMLLYAGANRTPVTRIGGYTPLHLAAKTGSTAVVAVLVKAGADANTRAASGAAALHFAAASGNAATVAVLLQHGADANARETEWGQTPLVFAAAYNRADAIRTLLQHGADAALATNAKNVGEEAALDAAAARRRTEVLTAVRPSTPPPAGWTPTPGQVQAAIAAGRAVYTASGDVEVGKVEEPDTADGAVPGFANQVGTMGGLSALHHAVRQGHSEAVLALLDGGADINQVSTGERVSPLLMAAINGQFDVALRLIERGADPTLASRLGDTPLYATINTQWAPRSRFPQPQAVQHQRATYLEVMKALLEAGADPNVRLQQHLWYFAYNNCGNANCGLENLEGTTPFWRAAYAVDVEAMKLLVAHGVDPKVPSRPPLRGAGRGGPGQRGAGAGGAAEGRGAEPQPAAARDSAAAAAAPLGADTSQAPVSTGVYPIHAAAGVGYGNGFAGNSHRHAPEGWMPALKYLVEELGADVNARDVNGYTPLHHAAARGDNEMILYLVSKGADVTAVARNGRTTADMANGPVQRLRPFPETVALLEKLGAKNNHRCVSC
jgi:ankyrin repeat protein